nr:very short patch repair endonuclease [Bifidobacterium lemurum]
MRVARGQQTEKYERGTRSYTMSRIRGKDTSIEVMVRRYLFSRGLRFRKNDKRYPGHPDVVLPRWHTIVFVNGCFWHMHDDCPKGVRNPKSNVEFWSAKLLRNRERDRMQRAQLEADGWHVITVWECELTKAAREERLERLYEQIVGGPADDATGDSGTAVSDDVKSNGVTPVGDASAGPIPSETSPGDVVVPNTTTPPDTSR